MPFPSPGNHPNPGIELTSSALADRFFSLGSKKEKKPAASLSGTSESRLGDGQSKNILESENLRVGGLRRDIAASQSF